MQAIIDLPEPSTPKQIQAMMGRMTALNRFISKSSERGLPFFKILCKAKLFIWDKECSKAFAQLKEHLALLPVLAKPLLGEGLKMYLSISKKAVAAVLVREEGLEQAPVFYIS